MNNLASNLRLEFRWRILHKINRQFHPQRLNSPLISPHPSHDNPCLAPSISNLTKQIIHITTDIFNYPETKVLLGNINIRKINKMPCEVESGNCLMNLSPFMSRAIEMENAIQPHSKFHFPDSNGYIKAELVIHSCFFIFWKYMW